jgi:glycosyltransferase involved in cell wall biosynthesis
MDDTPSKMKILFLGEPSSPNTMSWVEGLRELGCEVVLASTRSDGTDGVWPIGPVGLPAKLRALLGAADVKHLVRDIQPDILIAYRITSYGYLAAKSGFHPLVMAAQNEGIVFLRTPSWWRRKLLERFARFAIGEADMLHAWSPNIRDGLLEFGAEGNKILTKHRGIDLSGVPEKPRNGRKFDPERPVFVSTRSLYPEYKIDTTLKAFRRILDYIPEATLKIAGDGPERAALEALAEELEIKDNVAFTGRLPREKLDAELKTSDIYVSIIATEGMSSSLIEAVAHGLLPVVWDMPASRTLVENGVNGILVDDDHMDDIASAMGRAAAEFADFEPALAKAAEKTKNDFDRRENIAAFLKEYERLPK